MASKRGTFWWSAVAFTAALELATILARLLAGQSAAEFNRTANPSLVVKMHHLFWALPVGLIALGLRERRAAPVLWGLALGLLASDLAHHFVVLPLWVGNTGWHWP